MTGQEVDDIVEEAIQKKRNVKDILVEMKDTSELMVDLAYSALFTNSKDIAEEVEGLEAKMDDLQFEVETMLLLAARTPEDAADLSGILHVATAAEDIADSAKSISDVVSRGVGDHPIYQSFLGETEEKIVKLHVSKKSKLAGKTLGQLRLFSETGCFVRAVKRGARWVYNPGKKTKVAVGDVLITTGSQDSIKKLEELCGKAC